MHLGEAEFWGLTMRQLDALMRRLAQKQKREDLLAARVCMVMANINRDPKKRRRPFTEDDFMPKVARRQTWQQQLAFVEQLNAALGGEDHRPGRG